jgi:hypothetical protein
MTQCRLVYSYVGFEGASCIYLNSNANRGGGMSETSGSICQSTLRHSPECPKLWRFGFTPAIPAAELVFCAVKFWLSGTLAEFRKAPISLVMYEYVCLSILVEHLGSQWTDFRETWYLRTCLRKSVDKIQVSVKYDKNNQNFTWRPTDIYNSISLISS